MPKLPQVKPKDLVKFFQKQGFVVSRQDGSHARLIHPDGRKVTIAIHTKPIPAGTFNAVLKQANLTKDKFLEIFKN